jgi:hypothetical protein
MRSAIDHAMQLNRIAEEARETNNNSELLGALKTLGYVMLVLEACTLGFATFHLLHGDVFVSAVAAAVEIGLVVLHFFGMMHERQLHHNNGARIDRLRDECFDKEDDLLGTAAAFDIRVGRWYRRIRRDYD